MKIAPLWHELKATEWCEPKIVHTGQHHDVNMSDWFFRDLELQAPDYHLNALTGSHAKVTGSVMMKYEELISNERPDMTIVVGDVDSTIACALTAKKLHIPVAHLEAGLRSFDRTMPEEINRILTDSLSDLLWTPSNDGNENLINEGVSADRIQLVGNIMIDSLVRVLPKLDAIDLEKVAGLEPKDSYVVVTLHRPSNVDHKESLEKILSVLESLSETETIVFPVHPRTRNNLTKFNLWDRFEGLGINILEPLSYIDFIALVRNAKVLLTDSGGIQEEASFLSIPCLTLRPNTERPITLTEGTNRLVNLDNALANLNEVLSNEVAKRSPINLWDGKTAGRIATNLKAFFYVRSKKTWK